MVFEICIFCTWIFWLNISPQEQFVDLQKNAYVHPYGSKDAPRGPPRRTAAYEEEEEEDYPSEEEDYY